MKGEIEFLVRGDGIKPGLVRSHEIAELLEAIEALVTAEAVNASPSLKRDDIIVGLCEIAEGSIGLRFRTTMVAVVVPAFVSASAAISIGDFGSLAPQSIKSLQTVSSFSRRHNCEVDLKLADEASPLASIKPNTIIPGTISICGSTQMVGKVLRIGGKVPRAMVELADGSVIYCDITMDLARELGHRLYSFVILDGLAKWDSRTIELESFSVTSFEDFPDRDPLAVMVELARLIGSQLSHILDVRDFVSGLRRDGDLQ